MTNMAMTKTKWQQTEHSQRIGESHPWNHLCEMICTRSSMFGCFVVMIYARWSIIDDPCWMIYDRSFQRDHPWEMISAEIYSIAHKCLSYIIFAQMISHRWSRTYHLTQMTPWMTLTNPLWTYVKSLDWLKNSPRFCTRFWMHIAIFRLKNVAMLNGNTA